MPRLFLLQKSCAIIGNSGIMSAGKEVTKWHYSKRKNRKKRRQNAKS